MDERRAVVEGEADARLPHVLIVAEAARTIVELHEDQTRAGTIEEAFLSQVVGTLSDRTRTVPVVVTTFKTLRQVVAPFLFANTSYRAVVTLVEAFQYTFDDRWAQQATEASHVQWVLMSATLPT